MKFVLLQGCVVMVLLLESFVIKSCVNEEYDVDYFC